MGRRHRRSILHEARRRYNEKQKEAKEIIDKSKVLDQLMSTMRITIILIVMMIVLTPVLVYVRKHQMSVNDKRITTFTPQMNTQMNTQMNMQMNASPVHVSGGGNMSMYGDTPPLSSAYKSILGGENATSIHRSNPEVYPHQYEVQGLINGVKGAMKDLNSIRSVDEFY